MFDTPTPEIWRAARQGDMQTLHATLAETPEAIHWQASDDGCTLLHYAAFGGACEAVGLLLDSGANPNARAFAGHTPLHYAAIAGQVDCLLRLKDANADLYAVDDSLTTVVHGAAASGSMDILDDLLTAGLAPDTANLYGELPVHRAAQRNRLEIVQRLLALGSEQNPVDRYGMTLLHKAAIGGAIETTEWLLDRGFDALAGDLVGNTPMHSAASLNRHAVVQSFVEHGISRDLRNHDEATPLHEAAIAGHGGIVTLLLESGFDAAATDVLGRTPLHLAAIRGHSSVVKLLLEQPTSKPAPDVNGHRPIELAALYGRVDAWNTLTSSRGQSNSELSPTTVRGMARESVAPGEMMTWYLGHSGWAVRTARHLFILDYAPGEPEHEHASLVNGRVAPAEWGDVPVFVLVSHHHGDHFDRRILDWQHPGLRFVYGWDAPEELAGFRFSAQESKQVGDVVIAAIPATDAGSAFLIEADGVSFYHAGDHAAGQIPLEPEFTAGVEWLANQFAPVQAAFLPVFGCGLPNVDTLRAGNAFTIEQLKPDATLPMHIGWTSYFYRQFEQWVRELDLSVGLGIADQPGDRFLIRNGAIRQVWI